ncbi:maleylacetoacetate isomerase [Silvimonas terrae]|uniref:Maleylacetoacetate isomerase n=1 Tax=Silvimonas terrae TaxID=300266 RepID=A0A840RDY4_9NEIS|nr:maleylacetoacetate isomerase [Silvimonas terrae]MBB5190573.1 maleylacetoacetate isomerase [Silvimonas terrae]
MAAGLTLYSYFRSSATWRVRIALHLKGLPYRTVPIHLLRDGGEQHATAYQSLNPEGLVPILQHGDVTLTQSLAIMEYLEEVAPTPPLLPTAAADRARVRALALLVACDIHPVNNLRVLQYLQAGLGVADAAKQAWYQHWVHTGLTALEAQLSRWPVGDFCFGNAPTLADCCLIPQVYNARRFGCDLAAYPRINAIDAHCQTLPAFIAAAPDQQPDAA